MLETNRPLMKSLVQATSALLTLSVMISLFILLCIFTRLVCILRDSNKSTYDLWDSKALKCYIIFEYINALITLGPVVMWTYIWLNIANQPDNYNAINIGPGFIILWVVLGVRILTHLKVVKSCKEKCGQPRRPGQIRHSAMCCLDGCENIICFESVMCVEDCLEC